MSLDREYFKVVNADSGSTYNGLGNLPNKETAKDAAKDVAAQYVETVAILKVTVKTVATLVRTVTVATTDLP